MARSRDTRPVSPDRVQKPISDMAPEEPGLSARNDSRPVSRDSAEDRQRSQPSDDEIRARAYHRCEKRGRQEGRADEDWFEAERELKNR